MPLPRCASKERIGWWRANLAGGAQAGGGGSAVSGQCMVEWVCSGCSISYDTREAPTVLYCSTCELRDPSQTKMKSMCAISHFINQCNPGLVFTKYYHTARVQRYCMVRPDPPLGPFPFTPNLTTF